MPSLSYATYGGTPYRGETHEGLRSGKGRYRFSNSFFEYDGEFVDGQMHGEGTLAMKDGGSYQGTFVHGAMSGVGMRKWNDGSTYSGQFFAGELHGEGLWISAKGEQYKGTFVSNVREGRGTLLNSGGDQYEGEFHAHHMAGEGRMEYADGSTYDGQWVRSQRSGHGRQAWPAGDVFDGEWVADKPHGTGELTHGSGYSREGTWVAGEPETTATHLVLELWTPPPTVLDFAQMMLTPPLAAAPASEPSPAGEGDGEAAATFPELHTLSLRVSVVGADADAPLLCTARLVALDSDALAFSPSEQLSLTLPPGVARPLTVLFELCDDDGAVLASAEALPLPHDDADALAGTIDALALSPPPSEDGTLSLPVASLSASYGATETPDALVPSKMMRPTSEEAIGAISAADVPAEAFFPPFAAVGVRQVVIEAPPAEEAPEEEPATKGKGKAVEPEAEPAGPTIELYPVDAESGRAVRVTLALPNDVAEQRIQAAESAQEEAIPSDVPTGHAILRVSEATPPLSLFELPVLEPFELSITLVEKPPPDDDAEEDPPATKLAKK